MFLGGDRTFWSGSVETYKEGVGSFFRYFLDMKWGIEPRKVFGMIYGVGIIY